MHCDTSVYGHKKNPQSREYLLRMGLFVCKLCDVVAEGVFDACFEKRYAVLVALVLPLVEGVGFLEKVVVHLEEGDFKGCHLGVRGFLYLHYVYANYAGMNHVELFSGGT